jgi:hypothetical protein
VEAVEKEDEVEAVEKEDEVATEKESSLAVRVLSPFASLG